MSLYGAADYKAVPDYPVVEAYLRREVARHPELIPHVEQYGWSAMAIEAGSVGAIARWLDRMLIKLKLPADVDQRRLGPREEA